MFDFGLRQVLKTVRAVWQHVRLSTTSLPVQRRQQRMYAMAKASRLTVGWGTSVSSEDTELSSSLRTARARSRQLVRDAAYATRAKVIVQNNIVGQGIGMQAQVMNSRGELNNRINDDIETAWETWCEKQSCHTGASLHFADYERAVIGQVFEAGELFTRKHFRKFGASSIPFALELVEAERIADDTKPGPADANNGVRLGVEVDRFGAPIAYLIRTLHPGELRLTPEQPDKIERIPAEQIIHNRIIDRWPQTRGIPWMHAAARKLNDMDGLTEAEITAARAAACYMGFIESPEGESEFATTQEDGSKQLELEPAVVERLDPGEKFTYAAPNRPNSQLDPFMRMMLREVAAGTGSSYESLSRDYCVAPETRILGADMQWMRADALIEGTEILAFDEEIPGGMGQRRKWRKASIVRTGRRNLNRRRIVTKDATVTVSDEHLFLCTVRSPSGAPRGHGIQARSESPGEPGNGQRWVRADRLQPGDQIVFLCAPWETGKTHLHGYLKGIADGEGWLDKGQVCIGQNPGIVLDEIVQALMALGFDADRGAQSAKTRTVRLSITGMGQCLRFLGEVRPARLLQKVESLYDGRALCGGTKKTGKSKQPTATAVLAIDDIGVGPVVTIETSTRTLVTEGCCSHNSQSNYSSSRLALIDDRDLWRTLQRWFIRDFRMPIHKQWLQQAILSGAIPSINLQEYGANPAKFEAVRFKPRGWSWIDPTKEVEAYTAAILAGFTTVGRVIDLTGDGSDLEDILKERTRELEMMKEAGLLFSTDPSVVEIPALTKPAKAEPDPNADDEPGNTAVSTAEKMLRSAGRNHA